MEENEFIYFNENRTVFIWDIVLQKSYEFWKEILHLIGRQETNSGIGRLIMGQKLLLYQLGGIRVIGSKMRDSTGSRIAIFHW